MECWGIELIGYVGAACLISGYYLVSSGKWDGESLKFNVLNLTAAVIYAVYAVIREVPPVLIVQLFWGTIAIIAIVRMVRNKESK